MESCPQSVRDAVRGAGAHVKSYTLNLTTPATVVHGCAIAHAAEALLLGGQATPGSRTSGRKGTPASAAARGPVSAAAETASPLDCPRAQLSCQVISGPPSARQRARTDTAPCLPSPPPQGLKKEGTGSAALRPCRWFLPPPIPLVRGLCGSRTLLPVQRLCRSCLRLKAGRRRAP